MSQVKYHRMVGKLMKDGLQTDGKGALMYCTKTDRQHTKNETTQGAQSDRNAAVRALSNLTHRRDKFRGKKKLLNTKCVCFDILHNVCMKHFSFKGELKEIRSKMYIGLHVTHPLLLSDFNQKGISSTDFQKISPISNLVCGFGGLGVECWPLVSKFEGSNPAEAVGFLGRKKLSARLPSEGKERPRSHVVDLRHVKDPSIYVEVGI